MENYKRIKEKNTYHNWRILGIGKLSENQIKSREDRAEKREEKREDKTEAKEESILNNSN